METAQQNRFVLLCFLEDGKIKLLAGFCADSALTSAARHATVAFSFTIWKGERIDMQEAYKHPYVPKPTWHRPRLFWKRDMYSIHPAASLTPGALTRQSCLILKHNNNYNN